MSPGKPRNPAGSRNVTYQIRLTRKELARLKREARAAKVYLSAFIRSRLNL